MALTQENRALKIGTSLGEDVLLLTRFQGKEGISMPFRYQLDMISGKQDIEYSKILGKSVNVSIELADGGERIINGIITHFAKGDAGTTDPAAIRTYPYRATLQPAFWLLSLTGDCRIFQNLTAPKIVEKILQEHKIKYRSDLKDSYPAREYCVQYNESDFTFISRLLEEEGIFYYFEHEDNQHTLVLVERNEQTKPCPDQEVIKYCMNLKGTAEEDTISSLECEQYVGPTGFAIEDYNFNTPHADLLSSAPAIEKFTDMDLELYCYPGDFDNKSGGMRLVDMRMEEEEAHSAAITGSSSCRALQSGYHFELSQFYRDAMNKKKYLITSVRHIIAQSFEEGGDFQYANTFTCIPLTVKYRPMRTTHKPVMQGSQTATVTGPKGEEIHVDNHGRVKVQFHWDRYGKKDENTSCWIRVSYPSAGSGFGFQSHPRIGDEVIVDFLEGDPDRPIITGAVYNGANPGTYKQPDNKTRSVIRADSTPGGGGYNELHFENKKGSEAVYLQAEKDWNVLVKARKGQTIGGDSSTLIAKNSEQSVGGDSYAYVAGKQTEIAKEIIVSAYDKITLVCGDSSIVITPADIKLNGPKIFANDGSKAPVPLLQPVGGAASDGGGAGEKSGGGGGGDGGSSRGPAGSSSGKSSGASEGMDSGGAAAGGAASNADSATPAGDASPPKPEALQPDGDWKIGPVTDNASGLGDFASPTASASHLKDAGFSRVGDFVSSAGNKSAIKDALVNEARSKANEEMHKAAGKVLGKTGMTDAANKAAQGIDKVKELQNISAMNKEDILKKF